MRLGPLSISPPLFMAPMAGFTDWAFRALVRGYGGCGLPAAEMVSARGMAEIIARSDRIPPRVWGVAEEARPLAVQIWHNDPALLADVGAILVHRFGVSVVDLNFGCPVKAVREKAESGSYLLDHPERIGRIVAQVASACAPVPVTAKIRLGTSEKRITAAETAQAVEEARGAAVAVHGRTASQLYRGRADWNQIAAVKPFLRRIPLIGNGDIRTPQDAANAFRDFSVDGVMVGRGALGRPWLFREIQSHLAGEPVRYPTPYDPREAVLEHFRLTALQHDPIRAVVLMRKTACRYGHGRPGARRFRAELATVTTEAGFREAVARLFREEQAVE